MESSTEEDLLFVYGTLRRGSDSGMHQLLAQSATRLGPATFQGRLYRIDWYPGAIDAENAQDKVVGEVYQLREPARLWPRLDDYEGCGVDDRDRKEFVRVRRDVCLNSGSVRKTWIYLYNGPTADLSRIESGDFFIAPKACPARQPSR